MMKMIDMDAHPPFFTMNMDYLGEINCSKFFAQLKRAGIDTACGTLFVQPQFFEQQDIAEAIKQLNKKTMELALLEPRYIPVLWVHPECAVDSLEQLKQYLPLGARIIEVEAAWLEDTKMQPILLYAQEKNVALSLRGATPEQIISLTESFPTLKILVGGISDRAFTPTRTKEILEKCSHVYLKVSGLMWSGNYVLHEWSNRLNKERLLFGTGYPDCNPATRVAAAVWELRDQSESVNNMIFSCNARNIIEEVSE